MGNRMSATPTPESMVWRGVANILENRCPTTPAPNGGAGVVGRAYLYGVGWGVLP